MSYTCHDKIENVYYFSTPTRVCVLRYCSIYIDIPPRPFLRRGSCLNESTVAGWTEICCWPVKGVGEEENVTGSAVRRLYALQFQVGCVER
jgi:hypothetical protein